MRVILSLFLIFFTSQVFGQYQFSEPDLKKIKKEISKKKSEYYYPLLLDRYFKGDTGLNIEHYYRIYYGYSLQDHYSPYGMGINLVEINRYYKKKQLTEEDWQNLIPLLLERVEDYPVRVGSVFQLALAYQNIGDEQKAKIWFHHVEGLLAAILATGDGKEVKSAIWVLHVSDEYDLLNYMGFEFNGEQSLVGDCDFLTIKDNEYDLKGLFFNVSVGLNKIEKSSK